MHYRDCTNIQIGPETSELRKEGSIELGDLGLLAGILFMPHRATDKGISDDIETNRGSTRGSAHHYQTIRLEQIIKLH